MFIIFFLSGKTDIYADPKSSDALIYLLTSFACFFCDEILKRFLLFVRKNIAAIIQENQI